MNKIGLIAKRELAERWSSRSFRGFLILGPFLILLGIYIFLMSTTATKQHWNVLVMDKYEIMHNKIASNLPDNVTFYFTNDFVSYGEFAKLDQFQKYDLAISINKKILRNKQVIVSYRKQPPSHVKRQLRYLIEQRFEELMIEQFTDLSVVKFRELKQSFNFHYKNTYDPKNEISYTANWVGFVFGAIIILFIFMFGLTILRGVAKEKANRIVEVLLSSVNAQQLLTGKIIGIGLAAILQFVVWSVLIGGGLYFFRIILFPDLLSGNMVAQALSNNQMQALFAHQSPFVELIYHKIQYINILFFFLLFVVGGYLFYGSFFAMIGAGIGSESDGQQFVIPINLLLLGTILAGYYAIYHPDATITTCMSFIPFTSPMVMMVDLAGGFAEGGSWKLFLALIILLISALAMLRIAGRIYKNGVLQFNHRLQFAQLMKWLKG